MANLREVFTGIWQANLQLHLGKCNLLWRKTNFLGHVITDPDKVVAVKD